MIIKKIKVKDLLTKSNLPASDYVINPYVGCPHGCKYCYASFMKRFTAHQEEWGEFVDIKICDKKIDCKKIAGKTVFLSSVTDCYNELEEEYLLTRNILKQLIASDCYLSISTKSKLILRDLDLLKQLKHLTISVSINTLDETFKNDMDNASSIKERLSTLKELHDNGIYTVLFMSPIFPYITDWQEIIAVSKDFVDEYWFENLNLRGEYKQVILEYIQKNYNEFYLHYIDIYTKKNNQYWEKLEKEINDYCESSKIKYVNYFYHKNKCDEKKERKKDE